VLGLVHRRGVAAGGEWAELGRAAAEQEAALRALINRAAMASTPAGTRNLAADLIGLRSTGVTVAVPDTLVLMPADRADEVVAVVRAALQNVDQHAGPDASAYVFLEQRADGLVVTIRDDGVGMSAGRLDEAAAEGRLGMTRSIRGRVVDLGGTVTVISAPGAGMELELAIPADAQIEESS
jgi:signal transduction histidine kinase